MHKLKEKIYQELHMLEEKPMTEKSLEYIYKLVDIYKDILEIEGEKEETHVIGADTEAEKVKKHYNEYSKTKSVSCLENMLRAMSSMLRNLTDENEKKLVSSYFHILR